MTAGHVDERSGFICPFRNDSYLKGNWASKVCTFWTSTTGESLLTRLSKRTSAFLMFATRISIFANQSSDLERKLIVEYTLPLPS